MAVVRARSAPPYGLILFVFLTVVFAALTVVFYLQGSKAEKDRADLEKSISSVASPKEIQNDVRDLVSGNPNATALGVAMGQARKNKEALDTATGTVNRLQSELSVEKANNATMSQKLESLQALIEQNNKNTQASIKSANDTSDSLKAELVKAQGDLATLRAAQQTSTENADKAQQDIRGQAEQDRRQLVLEKDQLKHDLDAANIKVGVLQDEVKSLRPDVVTASGREADGIVSRTSTDTGEVYINLGKPDHLQPGQTFAVYDQKTGVRFATDAEAQGKGSIEVLDVGQNQSLCRVTFAVKGQAMQVGDLIANPVYHQDRTRKFHFTVIGDFDLDGDGVATAAEHDRLVHMIEAWGGTVDDNVTTQSDFVVAGTRPASPSVVISNTDAAGSVTDARTKRQQSYDEVLDEAKRSSVPILNSNRFLAMIGYYNTTVVHY